MAVQTLPFRTLITIDRAAKIPLFKQVADGIIELISSGKIKPGYQLPASRDMALILQLNRTTIVAAYEELQHQGWLEVLKRKGNFVAKQLPVIVPKAFEENINDKLSPQQPGPYYRQIATRQSATRQLKPYQLMINDGYPDARIAPMDAIIDQYKFLSKRTNLHHKLLADGYCGSASLRNELALFLSKTRALNITPQQILVTQGAQLAIYVAASMILKPGSTVIVGDLNYVLADRLFEQLGARLIKVRVDQDGIDVDAIERICARSKPDLLYIIPHHHHPTTVTLNAERRAKLLDIIRLYQLPVIEDDYDYDFHYDHAPILPLASSEHHGYVLYAGSISKTLSPTIRLGYLIGGEEFIWQATKLRQAMDIRGDVLFEEAVAHLFHTGAMQRHLRKAVKLYKERREAFCSVLNDSLGTVAKFDVPKGGMAVWTLFDPEYSIPQLSERLASNSIYLNDGSLYPYRTDVNGIRLGFASLNENELQTFNQALKQSL